MRRMAMECNFRITWSLEFLSIVFLFTPDVLVSILKV